MIVLGVETSGPVGSLALRRNGRSVEERLLPELGRRHAQTLVPEAVRFLRRHGLELSRVDLVAVSIGPGSFTGLRVGVTFAKTVAYAASASLAAIETFLAIAENTPAEKTVCVIADAQRRGVMLGTYARSSDGRFAAVGDVEILPVDELWGCIPPNSLLTGDVSDRIAAAVPPGVRLAARHSRRARAMVVAAVGEDAAARGLLADPWRLEPRYVRKSGAEEQRDAALGKSQGRA